MLPGVDAPQGKVLFLFILLFVLILGTGFLFSSKGGQTEVVAEVAAANLSLNKTVEEEREFSDEEKTLIEISGQLGAEVKKTQELSAGSPDKKAGERVVADMEAKRRTLIDSLADNLSPEAMFAVADKEVDEEEIISGRLSVTYFDDFDNNGESKYVYKLKQAGKDPIELATIVPLKAEAGSTVRLEGYYFGDRFFVDPRLDDPIISQPITNLGATGAQKTLAILVNFEDTGPVPFPAENAQGLIFGGQFAQFFQEQSYGRISFDGSVVGWLTLPRASDCEWPTFGDGGELDNMVLAAVPNIGVYNRIIILSDHNCVNSGFSTIGKDFIQLGNQEYHFSVAQIGHLTTYDQPSVWGTQPFPWTNLDYLLSHEMGHSLGLYHANGLDCHESALYGENCENVEYGNLYDVMGVEGYSLHFSSFYKERLGWIKPSEILTVDRSGNYKINNLESLAGYKAAKLKVQGHNRYPFYLEARRPTGFNANLGDSSFVGTQSGLFVTKIISDSNLYENFPNSILAYLLDLSPTSASWNQDIENPVLNSSIGLVDKAEGFKVGPVRQVVGNQVIFSVSVGNPVCVRNKASLDDFTFVNNFAAGSEGFLEFSFRNRDSFLCGEGEFGVDVDYPVGWSISNLDSKVVLGADQLSFQEPIFQVPPDTVPGTYNFIIRVTNLSNSLVSTLNVPVTVYTAPQAMSLSPESAPSGTTVFLNGVGIPETGAYVVFENDQVYAGTIAPAMSDSQLKVVVPENGFGGECQCEIPLPSGEYTVKFSASGVWSNQIPFTVEEGD